MTTETFQTGVLGKHPSYGDFLRAGLSEKTVDALSAWLDRSLAALRDDMGNGWAEFWDGAQDLRFWVGRGVVGRTLAGVLRPSQDRVGRRYPLILLLEGAAVPAPVIDPDQLVWDSLANHLNIMRAGDGARALLDGLMPPAVAEDALTAGLGPTIWAHHPEGDLGALLQAVAGVDAERACLTRSYWWAPRTSGRAAVWLGCPGLPEVSALAWLLSGIPADPSPEVVQDA